MTISNAISRAWRWAFAAYYATLKSKAIDRNVRQCSLPGQWNEYFDLAEPDMDYQWSELIWPRIQSASFDCVVELAPGGGRNTAKLLPLSKEVHLVDLNDYALDRCRRRFADPAGDCRIVYHKTDGRRLPGIGDGTASLIYTWDSMVHFEKSVVRCYVREFARVLRPGGLGMVHHSNYGHWSSSTEFKNNPHWRSNTTRELFAEYCRAAHLEVLDQTLIAWGGVADLDCISVFRRPDSP